MFLWSKIFLIEYSSLEDYDFRHYPKLPSVFPQLVFSFWSLSQRIVVFSIPFPILFYIPSWKSSIQWYFFYVHLKKHNFIEIYIKLIIKITSAVIFTQIETIVSFFFVQLYDTNFSSTFNINIKITFLLQLQLIVRNRYFQSIIEYFAIEFW